VVHDTKFLFQLDDSKKVETISIKGEDHDFSMVVFICEAK